MHLKQIEFSKVITTELNITANRLLSGLLINYMKTDP
jgi:hypothetical protein